MLRKILRFLSSWRNPKSTYVAHLVLEPFRQAEATNKIQNYTMLWVADVLGHARSAEKKKELFWSIFSHVLSEISLTEGMI